jgi:hypothetical protein
LPIRSGLRHIDSQSLAYDLTFLSREVKKRPSITLAIRISAFEIGEAGIEQAQR